MPSNEISKEECIILYNHNNCIVPKDATRIDIIDNGAVTHIRDQAFRDCSLLTTVSIVIPEDNSSEESCPSSSSPPSVTPPAPASIQRFGNWSFYQCSSLQSITIPKSVQIIGESSFSKCHALSKIDIPNTVTYIGWNAFCHCTSLKSIIIPSSVSCLANYTFHKCTSLKSVIIPEESLLIKIGAFAFSQCSSLQSIVLPQSVVQIGHQAFHSCWKLKERRIDHSHSHDNSHMNDDNDVNNDNVINNIDHRPSIENWLKVRYHNLPIHQACYYTTNRNIHDATASTSNNNNNDHSSSLSRFEAIIQNNIETIQTKDAMGMTPLHIYACNPTATYGFMHILLSACPDAIHEKDINGLSPLMLYFICKGILFPREYDYSQKECGNMRDSGQHDYTGGSNPEEIKHSGSSDSTSSTNSSNGRRRSVLPLVWDYFEDGLLTCDDLKIIFLFDSFSRKSFLCNTSKGNNYDSNTRDVDQEWSSILSSSLIEKDEPSGMYPYMSAATISNCGLDVVYLLAMKCPHHLMK